MKARRSCVGIMRLILALSVCWPPIETSGGRAALGPTSEFYRKPRDQNELSTKPRWPIKIRLPPLALRR